MKREMSKWCTLVILALAVATTSARDVPAGEDGLKNTKNHIVGIGGIIRDVGSTLGNALGDIGGGVSLVDPADHEQAKQKSG
ncbi:unnamed protein product [Lathyrus oleraceus]